MIVERARVTYARNDDARCKPGASPETAIGSGIVRSGDETRLHPQEWRWVPVPIATYADVISHHQNWRYGRPAAAPKLAMLASITGNGDAITTPELTMPAVTRRRRLSHENVTWPSHIFVTPQPGNITAFTLGKSQEKAGTCHDCDPPASHTCDRSMRHSHTFL